MKSGKRIKICGNYLYIRFRGKCYMFHKTQFPFRKVWCMKKEKWKIEPFIEIYSWKL